MNIKCLLFGCLYKQTEAKTDDGVFTMTGKCIRCGKEKVLVKDDIRNVEKYLGLNLGFEASKEKE